MTQSPKPEVSDRPHGTQVIGPVRHDGYEAEFQVLRIERRVATLYSRPGYD